jgi:alpha-L-rhamnosidase
MKPNKLVNLTCEYRNNPLGNDVAQPRLSWQLQSDRRGVRQTAYRIVAASCKVDLDDPQKLLWDSDRIESDQSIHVRYAGPALVSGQRVYWRVTVWDEMGDQATSAAAWWEMGLLRKTDWQARWIGSSLIGGPRTTSPAPYLRREFELTESVVEARLYATAIGVYEAYLNGVRIGEAVLSPGWTDYNRRVRYQVYDVTKLLHEGPNVIGAILGDGWAVGHVAWAGRQQYADRPRFLAQLVVSYVDGNTDLLATDRSWKTSAGPVLESDMLMGESYDARREMPGWHETGFDDTGWTPVELFQPWEASLVATNGPGVTRIAELSPQSIRLIEDMVNPRWIVDFGQNMVGWVRLKVSGPAGTTIGIRHAESLNPDGTIYTANLRTARNNDFYTLKGEGEEIWEPRFTFHGFRYVELAGFPGEPTAESVTAIVVHSEMVQTGSFESSNQLLNRLQHNILWGQKGNFLDVPTDCPQRDERLGWLGDAQVFFRTAAYNMNVAGFFTKWLQDLQDAQSETGSYPPVAPNPLSWRLADGGPAWADAGVIIPWEMYLCYGDTGILERQYESMRRYVDFLQQTSRDGRRCYEGYEGWRGFGDWLALDGCDGREGATPKELIGTAFYAYSTHLMSKIAGILGKSADAQTFNSLSVDARQAFQQAFVNGDGTIAGETQTGYVLALHFDLLPEHLRAAAAERLAQLIRDNDNHLSTGFVGTPYINWVLSESGHLDIAYTLLNQQTWPSWLYSVMNGGTTIWERWDGWTQEEGFQDPSMNSFNHYAYGAVGAWTYAVVGGIGFDPAFPGYKQIKMRPQPGGDLTSAKAELCSMYGTISSAWSWKDGQFDWRISVPANTSATIHIPASEGQTVLEGGQPAEDGAGVSLIRRDKRVYVFAIGSGQYHFATC